MSDAKKTLVKMFGGTEDDFDASDYDKPELDDLERVNDD